MSDIYFWKPAVQLFRPDKPLAGEELRAFYVSREKSPVDELATNLFMEDGPTQFLLAGHRGGGKTTELKRLEEKCQPDYTVVWVDTDTSLDKFNIGHAEVVVLVGMTIVKTLQAVGWQVPQSLCDDLGKSLARVTYEDKSYEEGGLGLAKLFTDLGLLLRAGSLREIKRTREISPVLSEIIARVNAIIEAAVNESIDLLVIVDGLDRKEYIVALEMFSSSLLTALNCHVVYVVPIALRYSSAFPGARQGFADCLDLDNVPVFKCDGQKRPTREADTNGRKLLANVITKRLHTLDARYHNIFEKDALELLCEKSGGVMRELMRLAKSACKVALRRAASNITLTIAEEAIREERRAYSIEDYHYEELDIVNKTGEKTSKMFDSPRHGKVVISDELLHYKLILGYEDPERGRWFDINPILAEDLARWREA